MYLNDTKQIKENKKSPGSPVNTWEKNNNIQSPGFVDSRPLPILRKKNPETTITTTEPVIQRVLENEFNDTMKHSTAFNWLDNWKETTRGKQKLGMLKNKYGISPQLAEAYLEQLATDEYIQVKVRARYIGCEENTETIGNAILDIHFNNTTPGLRREGTYSGQDDSLVNKFILNLDEKNKKISSDVEKMAFQSENRLLSQGGLSQTQQLPTLAPNSWIVLACHGDPRLGEEEPQVNIDNQMTSGKKLADRLKDMGLPQDRATNVDITACQTGWARRGTSFAEDFKEALSGYQVRVRAPISLSTTEDTGEMMLNLPTRSLMKNLQALMTYLFSMPSHDELLQTIKITEIQKNKKGLFGKGKPYIEQQKTIKGSAYQKAIETFSRTITVLQSELKWYFEDTAVTNIPEVQQFKNEGDRISKNLVAILENILDMEMTPEKMEQIAHEYRQTIQEAQHLVERLPNYSILKDNGNIPVEYQKL
jgi:hypothetical protein